MSEPRQASVRSLLLPMVGTVGLIVLSVVGAVVFVHWRQDAEHDVMQARGEKCHAGDAALCDLLRSACLKRSAEACSLLADAYATGKNRDLAEAARLFGDACSYRGADGCYRGGTMYATGDGVPKDAARAKDLFEHGCYLNDTGSCNALKQLAK